MKKKDVSDITKEVIEILMPVKEGGEVYDYRSKRGLKVVAIIVDNYPVFLERGFVLDKRIVTKQESENLQSELIMKREIKFRAWNIYQIKMEFFDGYLPELNDDENHTNWHIMQYTGLKDKNGREIYVWVILEFNRKKMQELKYELVREVVTYSQGRFLPRPFEGEDCEIIGNIYENPELIQQS